MGPDDLRDLGTLSIRTQQVNKYLFPECMTGTTTRSTPTRVNTVVFKIGEEE